MFGPGANLFTLGPNNTVQQFDLNSPAIMVANVQHPANMLPPSPPVSIEEATEGTVHSSTTINTSESESSSVTFDMGISESDDDHLSPFARLTRNQHPLDSANEMYDSGSLTSSRSGLTRPSAGSRTPGRYPTTMRSRGAMTENTYISAGSSLRSSTIGKQRDLDTYSMGYTLPSTSVPSLSSTNRSKHKPSRLRNEVPRSPDDNKVHDLFKYTRARLSDIPYKHPISANYARLTNDDLRRQMLSTIFGWNKEMEDLIRDEMSRHPQGSASRILLAKWLGDIDTDIMGTSSENMTSSDWMLLALSGIGGQASQHKLGRTYVQRLLESGDVHAAVTIMLGMGDHNDAIEIYISHKRYMEALILTCMAFPSVWERQSAIIKKWGEWAVQHGQQQLAIRCFACTDQESTEPWASPSAAQLTFQSMTPSIPEVLSPPLSPPGIQRGPQRSIAKTSALKLITSFGDQTQKSKFFSQGDAGQTPIPGEGPGLGDQDATTAFLRPSNNSRFNTPTTARPGGPSFGRGRLPSIGEMPSDFNREALQATQQQTLPIEQLESRLESRLSHKRSTSGGLDQLAVGSSLQRAATASPMMMRDGYQRIVRPMALERPPSPDANVMMKMEQARANRRNGSRDRIPTGISMKLQSLDRRDAPDTASEHSVTSSARYHWPTRRRGPGSVASSVTSASSAGRSLRYQATRNRDDYIHSLDTAQQFSKKQRSRHGSRERSRGRHGSRERSTRSREVSENRGRGASRGFAKPKRSPTSPVPMSPEDLINLSTPKQAEMGDPLTVRKASEPIIRPGSRASSKGGRRRSPDARRRPPALDIRGRSKGRDGSRQRSPSSPVPMPASAGHYQGSEDEEDFRLAMEAQEQFRAKHSRSVTRGLNSPALNKRDRSESRRRRANSESHDMIAPMLLHTRATSTEHAGDLRQMKDERQRKKEQAARDLEERRKSLAQRPQAPLILHPTVYSPALRLGVEMDDPKEDLPPRCATEPPKSMYARNTPAMGLPATPKAMRLVMDSDQTGSGGSPMPEVPPIPASFAQKHSPQVSPKASPEKEQAPPLTLLPATTYQLPSTVYQPPIRPPIPRSMSAPIPDDPPSHYRRKASGSELVGIEEVPVPERRRSHEEKIPPPPPPPPAPMLKELQHLAIPPPPPPAPLPFGQRPHKAGAVGSGMIEIVMDEDEQSDAEPVVNVPAPLSISHNRGSSIGDNSISGRFSKATERLRSASRTRKDVRPMRSQAFEAPYESIPTGLHRSEMI